MNEAALKSEVARFRQQVTMEYEAAQRGLSGLAQGTAQHAFITKRLENIADCHEALRLLVGEQEAMQIVLEALEQTGEQRTDPSDVCAWSA